MKDEHFSIPVKGPDDTLKKVATIWQLAVGVLGTTVLCMAFIFAVKEKTNNNERDNVRQDKDIEVIRADAKESAKVTQENQKKILDELTEIKLTLKDKMDRK